MTRSNTWPRFFDSILISLLYTSLFIGLASAETVTLTSSVEQAGRQAACPGEEVIFTCMVTESVRLRWIAEPFILQNNSIQFTASATPGDTDMDPSGQFMAILDTIMFNGSVADYTSRLIVTASVSGSLNGTVVQCSGSTLQTSIMMSKLFTIAAPPPPPQQSRYSVSQYSLNNFTVAVQWESPASDGGMGIDNYTLTGAGITDPLTVLSNEPLMTTLTLSYNEMHMVSITASNCAGESTATVVTIHEGDCGVPVSPTNGTVAYTTTTEGSLATFQCSASLVPVALMTAVCEESGGGARWSPDPGDLSCVDVPVPCNGALGSLSCDDLADGMCYTASYAVQPDDSVTFTVSAMTPSNTWVGLGVSDDRFMPNSDIVLGAADGTNSFIHDRFAFEQAEPPIDPSQDIESASAERVDGVTTITFNRPRKSVDTNDTSLDECRFFLFACGGQVNFFSMPPAALTHGMGPTRRAASLERICIPFTECSAATPADSSDQAVVIAVVVVVVIAVSVAVVATVIIVYLCWRKRSSGAFVVKTEAAADVSNDYARVTGRGVEMDSLAKDTCTNGFYDRPDTQKPAAERLENATDGFYSYADTRRLPPPQDKAGEASAEEYSQLQRQNAPKGVIDLSDLTYSHLQTGSGAVRTSLEETSPLPARLEPEGVAPPHTPKSPVSGPPRPARRSRRQTPERNIEMPSRPPKPAPYRGDQ